MGEPTYLSSFLIAHQGSIASSSHTADELVLTFRDEVSPERVLRLFTDLLTFCRPVPTRATIFAHRHIRLEF